MGRRYRVDSAELGCRSTGRRYRVDSADSVAAGVPRCHVDSADSVAAGVPRCHVDSAELGRRPACRVAALIRRISFDAR
jgi:hypothetical protein